MARKTVQGKGSREAYWRRQVAAWGRSGESVRGYCRAHGLTESGFHFWKGELKRRDAGASSGKSAPVPSHELGTGFAEVRVAPSAAHEALIEIACAGTRRVRVYPGFDEETLARVLGVLERAGADAC